MNRHFKPSRLPYFSRSTDFHYPCYLLGEGGGAVLSEGYMIIAYNITTVRFPSKVYIDDIDEQQVLFSVPKYPSENVEYSRVLLPSCPVCEGG